MKRSSVRDARSQASTLTPTQPHSCGSPPEALDLRRDTLALETACHVGSAEDRPLGASASTRSLRSKPPAVGATATTFARTVASPSTRFEPNNTSRSPASSDAFRTSGVRTLLANSTPIEPLRIGSPSGIMRRAGRLKGASPPPSAHASKASSQPERASTKASTSSGRSPPAAGTWARPGTPATIRERSRALIRML